MNQQLPQIPPQALSDFCTRHRIRRLALFGSAVRGDFGPRSDIDVLIDFEPDAPVGFMALGRMQRELTALFRRKVDLVPQAGLKPLIREEVLASAEVLYAS